MHFCADSQTENKVGLWSTLGMAWQVELQTGCDPDFIVSVGTTT